MTDRPLNILIVASWYPDKENPTSGSFIYEQAELLNSRGHNVTILHPFLLGSFKKTYRQKTHIEHSIENGNTVIRVGVRSVFPGIRVMSYKYCFQACLKAFRQFSIDFNDFDLIHSHAAFMGGYIGMSISKNFNIPQVHTEHSSGLIFEPDQYSYSDIRILRSIYNHAERLLFVSTFAKHKTCQFLQISNSVKIDVLPNLVADQFFKTDVKIDILPIKYLIIGNFIPVKNHELLLRAFSKFQDQFPEVELSLVGDGPLQQDLKHMVKSLGLKNIIWKQRLGRNGILEQLKTHQVVLSTSQVETFGLSLAEAQAMGKPVVVTASGGVRDIVTKESGIITEMSAEDYAKGLVSIQKNYTKYNAYSIRKQAYQKFSSDVIYKKLLAIYQSALV